MKSSYELALERLEDQGIDRPREEGLPEALKQQMADVRSKAEARLAELEILHKQAQSGAVEDPAQLEEEYRSSRERIEQRRDRDLERLREQA